ncbi:hypothetical protein SAMN05216223_107383 [Actinacidiphila yanglinensis]|uniref:DUF5667 domain-containing protein n=1 Tax=Actinacidiphila yanglinensis TaxID=310779 RepID=A0A1H6BYZ0_9ACTN|nr:DUF5667 domain-containing protein [Actinacidiphila yanglinensis]SEG65914.1 hypothetical protein SAMN05216223_107383 [Actinacidiphila yanglinensis]
MIGQATAHRRANAFAQAVEDAGLDGGREETTGEHGAGAGADATADDPRTGARGTGSGGRDKHGAHSAGGHGAGHGSHAADRNADPEQVSMVALAGALGRRPRPAMDPESKTVQRAQLIAAMEQAIADGSFRATARVPEQRAESSRPASALRRLAPRSRLSRRIAVGGLTMGVAAGAFGGVAAASTNALPGDSLYGLKRSMEDIKLDMAGNDASRGKVYLDMASTRMQEARRLMDRGRGGQLDDESVGEVRRALSGMNQEASEGHRLLTAAYRKDGSLQPMELLNTFAESHRESWTDLSGKLPSQLADVSDQVTSLFDAIDAEVAPLSLPQKDTPGTPATRGGTGNGSGHSGGTPTGGPSGTPSATTTAKGSAGEDSGQTPSPSPSGSVPDGLIGGSGNLFDTPTGQPTTGTTPTETPTTPHSVELPPLLPGLLPGLGLTSSDDDQG